MESRHLCSSLVERDLACIWHPFTQAQTASPPIPIVKGKGAYLYSEIGDSFLDGISSWWVNLHGHAHPYIAEKIATQARELEQVIFAGYTHPQAIIFAERLLSLFSGEYSHIFYSDNGSTAVEVALKMALQVKGNGKKVLSFQNGYHGDTFGAMSAGNSHFHKPFWPYLFQGHFILPPLFGKEEKSWEEFASAIRTDEIAVFIFEPLIQGGAGMIPHSGEVLARMIQKCQEVGILTIADEVMTGFGRTGSLFACNLLGVAPDIITLSKGITGGFLPMGATIVKKFIFDSFLSQEPSRAFLHGHSYTANPLACAAANASLDLLLKPECFLARKMIESEHLNFQKKWKQHDKLVRCDVVGTILSFEYKIENDQKGHLLKQQLINFFQQNGIILRPLGNVFYLLPPYCISREELQKIYSTIVITLEEWL